MDNFIGLAKQGLQAYERSQSDVSKTGGQEYNSPSHSNQGNPGSGSPDIDHEAAVSAAASQGSGDRSLFSSAMGFLNQNKSEHQTPVDEASVTSAHQAAYSGGDTSSLPASSLGSAAALQVLKQFTSGGGSSQSGGGNNQTQLISMAMSEASKLFDSKGAGSGDKQDAINGAAMTVMKLVVQSKFSGTTGGSDSGGLSGLMGLASQFMKK